MGRTPSDSPGHRSTPRRWAVPLALALVVGGSVGVALGLSRAGTPGDGADEARPTPTDVRSPRTIHVSTDGTDDGDGTAGRPVRTIAAAVRTADDGDTIVVGPGVYREALKIEDRPGLKVVAAPGAEVWLDGSVVVDDWSQAAGAWVSPGWDAEFDASPTYSRGMPDSDRPGWSFVDPAHPMAAHPDQVWIDGERQQQVGARDEVTAGTFFVDHDRDELVLGSDPGGNEVTASARTRALRVRSPGVTVRGIDVRRYSPSVPDMGAVTVEAPDVTLEDVTVSDSATTGVHVLGSGVTLKDVLVERNGMLGLSATEADRLQLLGVTVRANNLERFNQSPAAGGAKIGRSSGVTVDRSVFADNLANGLWFDESSYDIRLLRSRLVGNAGHGLSVELSGKVVVIGNVIARNHDNGLKINDSEDVQVWNNTFADNDRSINVVQDRRDVEPQGSYRDPDLPLSWQTQTVEVRNNVLARTDAAGLPEGDPGARVCLLCVEDYSGRWTAAEMDVTALGNVYQRPDSDSPRWLVVWSRRDKDPFVFRTVEQFRATVQQEETGAELTGTPALTEELRPSAELERLHGSVAQPLPEILAELVGQPPGTRHLGAWTG